MKQKELFLLLWLCIFPILNYAQSNYKLEYWFNDDYTKVSSLNFTAVTGEFTELTIPAAHVPFGMNKIHCRVLDADNKPSAVWYSYFTRGYIGTPKTIIEYWYDEDMTKTFRNTVTNSDLTIEFNAEIKDLSVGLHTMHIRTGYENLAMTAPQTSYFYKLSEGQQKPMIEYWFDDDIANKVTFAPNSFEKMLELSLNASALSTGIHKLSIRAGIQPARYSPVTTSTFFKGVNKYQIPITGSKILNYRYWFDDEQQNMYTGTIADVTQEITFLKDVNANILDKGKHNISVQFQNSLGQWSDVAYGEFEKKGNRVLKIPQLLTDRIFTQVGGRINLSGYNYSKNGKLKIDYASSGYFKSDTLYANNYGRIEYGFTAPQPGNFLISTTDLVTNLKNPGFYIKVLASPYPEQTQMKLLFPAMSGYKLLVGDTLTLQWTDVLKNDRRYPINQSNAERGYQYLIEIDSIDGNKINEQILSGNGSINSDVNFRADYIPAFTGKYIVKIFDQITNNFISTEMIEVVENLNNAIINTEWDFTMQNQTGGYSRAGKPIGVAADGTARMYLTVAAAAKTIQEVNLSVYDETNTTSPDLLGRVMPATVTGRYSDEANNAVFTNTTSNTIVDNKCWFWYVAPVNFVNNESAKTKRSRTVNARFEITFTDNTTEIQEMKIEIVRPPVMFVHGLGNSAERCWGNFKLNNNTLALNDPTYTVIKAVDIYPDRSFERNANALLGIEPYAGSAANTFKAQLIAMRMNGYSANKVDYISHNMGGNILRFAVEHKPDLFYVPANYGKGYTNKVIMIDAPNDGTPIADAVELITGVVNEILDQGVSLGPIKIKATDILSSYNILEKDYERYRDVNDYFNIYNYIRPYNIVEPTELQKIINFWALELGSDYQTDVVRKFSRTLAVQNLSMQDGVRFTQPTLVKAHLIAGDVISGVQDWKELGQFNSEIFNSYMAHSESFQKFIDNLNDVLEVIIDLKLVEGLKILNFKNTDTKQLEVDLIAFKKQLEKVKSQADKNMSIVESFDLIIKRINNMIDLYNGASFLVDGDFIVSLKSQLGGENYNLTNNTIFSGLKSNHFSIVDNPQIQSRVAELLNSDIKSDLFAGIPAYVAPYQLVKRSEGNLLLATKPVIKTQSVANTDTIKKTISILFPASATMVHPKEEKDIIVQLNDTTNLSYVELRFQGKRYTDFSHEKNLIFKITVNGDYLNEQDLTIKARYYNQQNDSTYNVYASINLTVTPTQIPVYFSANKELINMNVNDTASTGYEVIFPDYIYNFSIDKNLLVKIDNPNYVSYNPKQGNFIAKSKGNTFAEVEYAGLKDTIYFVLKGTTDVTTHIPNTKYANNNFSPQNFNVYPNPAKSFTTITSTKNIEYIELCDITGRTIQSIEVDSKLHLLDLNQLPKGIYLIKGFTEGGLTVRRFVKE